MTKLQICKLISESLEPEPAPWTGHLLDEPHCAFWIKQYSTKRGNEWVAVNYFESEDASAKIWDAMPAPQMQTMHADQYRETSVRHNEFARWCSHKKRKTAIVLAFMRWAGIEGKIDEE